ncbi:MAG TPA: DUF1420 family protein, partial [Syntrophorhabdales bacterium]|nr:DUF1420 family protein [Syntrophorhabdales bacterium]
ELWLMCRARNLSPWRRFSSFLYEQPILDRATVLLLLGTSVCLVLLALSPPTDADSLDYHLGVPLDFLRRGDIYPRYDWFHARLIGSGEVLNMLGLAGGTDMLGATLSAGGLFALVSTVISRLQANRDRIFIVSCLISCPFLLFLLPNQKPFLLPAVANTLALLMIWKHFRTLDVRSLLLAFGCCVFAMSCKYSFLLSGSTVLIMGLVAAYRSRRLAAAMGMALLFYLVMIFPMEMQKFLFYGDPISPMLEGFRHHGDAALIRFAQFIRYYAMSTLPFPLGIIVPYSPGSISSVLGLGVLACIVALFHVRYSPILIIAAFATVMINYLAGARSAGYYLEPYTWLCIAAASIPWNTCKKIVYRLLMAQVAAMLLFVGFGAAKLFPGSLTAELRDHVMRENAHQYAVMRWLDDVLPRDAVVLSTLRSHALMPRPFVAKDIVTWTDWTSPAEAEKATSIVKAQKFDTVVAEPLEAKELTDNIGVRCTAIPVAPKQFLTVTRNPWNRAIELNLAVYGTCFAEEPGMASMIRRDSFPDR